MKIELTLDAAKAGGYSAIIVDPDVGGYRCYTAEERQEPTEAYESASKSLEEQIADLRAEIEKLKA